MNEGIKNFLNNETYILAYRSNYDSARELNQQLIDYVKDLQNRIDKALNFIDCHFKEMVADEEAQKLKSILKESGE